MNNLNLSELLNISFWKWVSWSLLQTVLVYVVHKKCLNSVHCWILSSVSFELTIHSNPDNAVVASSPSPLVFMLIHHTLAFRDIWNFVYLPRCSLLLVFTRTVLITFMNHGTCVILHYCLNCWRQPLHRSLTFAFNYRAFHRNTVCSSLAKTFE